MAKRKTKTKSAAKPPKWESPRTPLEIAVAYTHPADPVLHPSMGGGTGDVKDGPMKGTTFEFFTDWGCCSLSVRFKRDDKEQRTYTVGIRELVQACVAHLEANPPTPAQVNRGVPKPIDL